MCEGTAQNEAVFRLRSLDVGCRRHHRFPEVPWKVSQNFHKEVTNIKRPFLNLVFRGTNHPQWLQESVEPGKLQNRAPPASALTFSACKNSCYDISELVEALGLKNSRRSTYPGILSLITAGVGGCLRTKYLRGEQTVIGKNPVVFLKTTGSGNRGD